MPIFEEPSPLNAATAGLATYMFQKRQNQAAAQQAAALLAQQSTDARQRAAAAAAAAEQERYNRSEDAKRDALAQSRETRDAAASAATTARTQSEAVIAPGQRNPFTGKIEGKYGTYGYQQAQIGTKQAQAILQKTFYENAKASIDLHYEDVEKKLAAQLAVGRLNKEHFDILKAQVDAQYAGALHQAELQSHLASAAHSWAGAALDNQRREQGGRGGSRAMSERATFESLSPQAQNLVRHLKAKGMGADAAASAISQNHWLTNPAELDTLMQGGVLDKELGRGLPDRSVDPYYKSYQKAQAQGQGPGYLSWLKGQDVDTYARLLRTLHATGDVSGTADQQLNEAYRIYQEQIGKGVDPDKSMAQLTGVNPTLAKKLKKLLAGP